MLVSVFDDFDRESQSLVREVRVVDSSEGASIFLHELAGFVHGMFTPYSPGSWVVYVGF